MMSTPSQSLCTCDNLFEPLAAFHDIGCRYRVEFAADLRARLSLEQRDEPRERGWSMIDEDSGMPTQGEI